MRKKDASDSENEQPENEISFLCDEGQLGYIHHQ